jgi:Lar family restriction alleviation protein
MSDETLLPCPFCGNADLHTFFEQTEEYNKRVACPNCGIGQPSSTYNSKAKAVAAWNTRTTPASQHSELADFHGQVAKRAEDIEKDVEKHFADIKSEALLSHAEAQQAEIGRLQSDVTRQMNIANEQLQTAEAQAAEIARLTGEINAYKDALAQAEGMIADLQADALTERKSVSRFCPNCEAQASALAVARGALMRIKFILEQKQSHDNFGTDHKEVALIYARNALAQLKGVAGWQI